MLLRYKCYTRDSDSATALCGKNGGKAGPQFELLVFLGRLGVVWATELMSSDELGKNEDGGPDYIVRVDFGVCERFAGEEIFREEIGAEHDA